LAEWPTKKGVEKKKGHSAINDVVTRDNTINIHKSIHGAGFKKHDPRALKDIRRMQDVRIDTRLNKDIWAQGMRDVLYCIQVRLLRKCNEDENSPYKFHTSVTCVPVTTLKNLQMIIVDEN
ncbi:mCG54371, partial [Mus musculus]